MRTADGLRLCGRRPEDDVEEVLGNLRGAGHDVRYVQADVGEPADRSRLVASLRKGPGRLHVLVNNAWVAPRVRADILDADEESFDHLVRVNLKGPYFLTQALARWMIEQRRADASWSGCIVRLPTDLAGASYPSSHIRLPTDY